MARHQSTVTTIVSAFVITFAGMGCSSPQNPLGSDSPLDMNSAAEAIASLPGNNIDSELLALADDIEEVSVVTDNAAPLPSDGPRPNLNRLQSELNLTDDQIIQIDAIITATRDLLTPIHEQVRDGSLTREEARTQIEAIREDKKTQIEAVLTTEQAEKFAELRHQHGRQFNRKRLADFLNLTDDQVAQIKALMGTRKDELQSIREQVEAGTLTREDARTQLQALRESERDEITALLNADQLEKFNTLQKHSRFGFGPRGFGRGPRGLFQRPGRA
jgi:Spy/CpxP family protein refolding chaperone